MKLTMDQYDKHKPAYGVLDRHGLLDAISKQLIDDHIAELTKYYNNTLYVKPDKNDPIAQMSVHDRDIYIRGYATGAIELLLSEFTIDGLLEHYYGSIKNLEIERIISNEVNPYHDETI